ncbi:MAG TPA: hypothetical protein VK138_04595 [Acidiferrobacterales bacterium]|nr:hypothetical protein [Acidiferrobacterales bacterium]
MKNKVTIRTIATTRFVFVLLSPFAALGADESRLDKFEKDIAKPGTPDKPHAQASSYGSDTDSSDLQKSFISDVLETIFLVPGKNSMMRIDSTLMESPQGVIPRQTGDGLLVYARLDTSYQRVDSDISGVDSRLEIGYGAFGLEIRQTRYRDTKINTHLQVDQYHGLYRMSFGNTLEIGLGYGETTFDGTSRNSGHTWATPVLYQPLPWFGIEYRPSWMTINNNEITDNEFAVDVGGRYWAVRGGYRQIKSPTEKIVGPFIGLSLRF